MRCAVIGRFQPMHLGHIHLIKEARKRYLDILIVVGSAQYSHTLRNPFTAGERIEMVYRSLRSLDMTDFLIIPIEDIHRHALWVEHVLTFLPRFQAVYANETLTQRLFRERGVSVHTVEPVKRDVYCASEIRRRMAHGEEWSDLVPEEVANVIEEIDGVRRIREIASSDSDFREDRFSVNRVIE